MKSLTSNKDIENLKLKFQNLQQELTFTKKLLSASENRYKKLLKEVKKNKYESDFIKANFKANEDQLRNITNSIPGIIYQFKFHKDGSFSVPYISDKAHELLGFDRQAMMDANFLFSRIHPDDFHRTMQSVLDAGKHDTNWTSEFRALNNKNEIVWIKGSSHGVMDKEGNIIHNGVFQDISDLKRIEKELALSIQRNQNIADNIPGLVLRYKLYPNEQDELLYISKGVKFLFEVTQKEALEKNRLLWLRIHPDDFENYLKSIKKSAEELSLWKIEHRLLFPDGRVKWVASRGVPNKTSDGSIIWDSICFDITHQKNTEEELAQLNKNLEKRVEERTQEILNISKDLELYKLAAQHSKTGVWLFDLSEQCFKCDHTLYDLYEIDSEQHKSIGFSLWKSRIHPDDVEETVDGISEAIQQKKPWDKLFRIVSPSTGKILYVRGKGTVEHHEDRSVAFVYGTNWDVTREMELAIEREKALNDLKDAQLQLIQTEKMSTLGILTADVAHEINNPLNYILGGHAIIKKQLKEHKVANKEQLERYLSWIKIGAERTTKIVKTLNQFSNKNEHKIELCNLHKIIEDCITMLDFKLDNSIEISRSYFASKPVIYGDASTLHQAILNVLSNAVDACKQDGEIEIKTASTDTNVIITIQDNGIGIPKEELSKITDPFYTTKPQGLGTGLGLSITKSILLDHKGTIDFQSEVNQGTKVYISLPKNSQNE